jgi:hypothetical protein
MTPLTPLHHLQQHPRAGSQGVGIATLIFRYFLRYFSSTHRTDLSRFGGTFHSFDPVGFAIFAIPSKDDGMPASRELSRSGPVRVFRKRESPVLFSQEGEVRFQKAYVDQNGSIRADGHNLDLYGAVLIRRDRICTSAEGARWTCGQRAYMTLRALLAQRPITCSFKPISVPPKAVCSVDDQDIAQFLLREGWAELPIDVTDQAYVEASELAHSRGLGIWGDAPP